LAHTVCNLLGEGSFDAIAGVRTLSALEILSAAELPRGDAQGLPNAPPTAPIAPSLARATIGVTALADFAACPRRFSLLHVEGIREPELARAARDRNKEHDTEDDPRALGSAAHAVLERWPLEQWGTQVSEEQVIESLVHEGLSPNTKETRATAHGIATFLSGAFAASLREPGVRVYREFAMALPLTAEPPPVVAVPNKARQLELFAPRPSTAKSLKTEGAPVLKATFDLVIERPDGSIDVIDYKRSRGGDAERYEFQLAAYRTLAQKFFGAERIRTGLVHLLGEALEPEWQTPPNYDLRELVTLLVTARYSSVWNPVPRKSCVKLRCGFLSACHPKAREP
jgi:ATP-dependent helicase/nuclease subunit A